MSSDFCQLDDLPACKRISVSTGVMHRGAEQSVGVASQKVTGAACDTGSNQIKSFIRYGSNMCCIHTITIKYRLDNKNFS